MLQMDENDNEVRIDEMLIFLDSNIICSNYYMRGPSFEVAQRVGTIVLGKLSLMRSAISIKRIWRSK